MVLAPAKLTPGPPGSTRSPAESFPTSCDPSPGDGAAGATASAGVSHRRLQSPSTRAPGECPTGSDLDQPAHPTPPRLSRGATPPAPARSTLPITLQCAARRDDSLPAVTPPRSDP